MEDINRKKILEEIREEIREKGYASSEVTFRQDKKGVNRKPYSKELMATYCQWIDMGIDKDDYLRQTGKHSFKSFVKSIIRRIIKPVTAPSLEKQESINISISEAVNMVFNYMLEKDEEINELKRRIFELEKIRGEVKS